MRDILWSLAGACLLAAAAQPQTLTAQEATTVSAQLPAIAFEKHVLDNGLQVILHEDHKLPFASVNLWYHVGSKDERPGRTGFAHLFEHMMFQGSKNADGEYLARMERLGANLRRGGVNGTTSRDRTNYFETVPSPALERVLWMESDRMAHLLDALDQEKLDNQRDVVKNERRQSFDNVPYGRAEEVAFANIFPAGHPYSWPIVGSMEDLGAATLDDVKQFFRTFYTPNNCSLVIAGDIDPAAALKLAERYFGPIPPGPPIEHRKRWLPRLEGERRIVVRDRVPQERLYVWWPAEPLFAPGEVQLDVLSQILAQGKTSRLYKRLVYDEQIATDVSAFNWPLEIAGVFAIIATARPGKSLAEIEAVIDEEIANIASSPPSREELERAKAQIEFSFLSGLERTGGFGGKANILNRYNTLLGDPDYFEQDYRRYQAVTGDEVTRAASRYLQDGGRLVVSFVPEISAGAAQTDLDRSLAPAIGERRPFAPPAIASDSLPNGMQVLVVQRPELPKVVTGLYVEAGARLDPAGKAGTAWMTAGMLDEGTTSRSALEISAELQRLGSRWRATAGYDGASITMPALHRNLRPSLELMADMVMHPIFPDEELDRVRKRRLDDILQERADARSIAGRVFRQLVFGADHPYGHPLNGDEPTVKALARDDLERFHAAAWAPDRASLVFVGNVTLDEAMATAEHAFGNWESRGTPPAAEPIAATSPPGRTAVYLVDRQDAAQTAIRVGCPAPGRSTRDYYALEVMKTILGGSFAGRLNMNLREDKGYAYGAFARLWSGREAGHLVATASVQTEVTREALAEFLGEMRGAAGARPFTGEELAQARDNLIRGYAQNFESLGSVVGQIGQMLHWGIPVEELGRFTESVEAVTLADVRAIGEQVIDPDRLYVVAVGDLGKIEGPIRDAGVGDVVILDADGRPVKRASVSFE